MAQNVDELVVFDGQLRVSGEGKIPTVLALPGKPGLKHCAYIQGATQFGNVNDFTVASPQKGTVMIGGNTKVKSLNALAVKGNIHQTGALFTSTGDAIFAIGTQGLTLSARFGLADDRGKTFDIKHPSKDGYRLRYACIEGPEVGIYYRGRLKNQNKIKLPYYWKDLIHVNSITVQLQPIGAHQDLIVKRWDDEFVYLQAQGGLPINCFYHVYAERKDINPLHVEYEGDSWKDYPDPNYVSGAKNPRFDDPQYAGPQNTVTI
tara:strand:+ start:450 stop:1235 length:786 start_codon:yes stop_codon:yes gene_type:complete